MIYTSLPQDEKSDGSEVGEAEEISQPIIQTMSLVQRRIIIAAVCFTLLMSLLANGYFLYQHYMVPWELADRLPSKFGTSHLSCKAVAVTVIRFYG